MSESEEEEKEKKKKIEYPLPELFERNPSRGTKVVVENLYYERLKTAIVLKASSKGRWVALKVGKGKALSWYKYMPVIIEGNVYTLVSKNPKRKFCVFDFLGPYDKMDEILEQNESTIVNG